MAGVRRLEDVVLGKKQIQAVKADELQEYIFNLANVCAMATIKRQRIVLNITFTYAVELGLIEENPMNKVKLPNKANVVTQEREPVFLTVEQRKRLEAEVASNEKNPRTGKLKYDPVCALCSTFLLHSGLRIGELRALRWKNVDMDSGFIWVRENGTMITEQNANRTLKKMLKNCGLIDEGIEPTLHDLRHTFASELIAKGADIKTLLENGYDIELVPPSQIKYLRMPDIIMNGEPWEMKAPEGDGKYTVQNNMQNAAGQSRNVIIDLRRCKMPEERSIREFEREFGQSHHFKKMKIIKKGGIILDFSK